MGAKALAFDGPERPLRGLPGRRPGDRVGSRAVTACRPLPQGTVRTCARLLYSPPPLCARLALPGLGERERSRDLGLAASACCHLPPSGG